MILPKEETLLEQFTYQFHCMYKNCSLGTEYLSKSNDDYKAVWTTRDILVDTLERQLSAGIIPTPEDVAEWLTFISDSRSIEWNFIRWYVEIKAKEKETEI
mgnify:CR=1 FL=1|jgi:hypothetical protein|tara:strand:+ start:1016 stop:1318 length:303 start_codon:yes stop_codon:yes gene_type:complete